MYIGNNEDFDDNFDWIYNDNDSGYKVNGINKCLHKNCPECYGNGHKTNGEPCIHMISCNCLKCSPSRGASYKGEQN